jgi:hypothetical protein
VLPEVRGGAALDGPGERRQMRDGRRATRGVRGVAAAAALGLLVTEAFGCDPPGSKKAFGQACALDDECASAECARYGSVCSKACTYDKECGPGYVCRSRDDSPGAVCSKPQGQPPGGRCMTSVECQHGRCLHGVGEQDKPGFCSAFCQGAEDCPAELNVCGAIEDSGELKLCTPGDATAPANARLKLTAPSGAAVKVQGAR